MKRTKEKTTNKLTDQPKSKINEKNSRTEKTEMIKNRITFRSQMGNNKKLAHKQAAKKEFSSMDCFSLFYRAKKISEYFST